MVRMGIYNEIIQCNDTESYELIQIANYLVEQEKLEKKKIKNNYFIISFINN